MVSRLNEKISDFQAELYFSVLSYGLASDAVLTDDSYALVKANGGYVGSFDTAFGVAKNVSTDALLLRANAANANGEYFLKWVDENGNTVSQSRVCSVADLTAGYKEFTAVYGEASESIYAHVKNFDYLETGVIELNSPDLSKAPTGNALGSYNGTNMKRWDMTYRDISDLAILHVTLPEATVVGQDSKGKNIYEFTKDGNGNYKIGERDTYSIAENMYGDKMLSLDIGQRASGISIGFNNSGKGCFYAEFDLKIDGITRNGVQYLFNFTVKDGTNESSYRTNIYGNAADDTFKLYAEGSASGIRDANTLKDSDGNDYSVSMKAGETATIGIKFVTDATTPYIEYYINGECIGKIVATEFKAYNANMDFTKAQVTYFSFGSVAVKDDPMSIDNITFR